MFAAENAPTLNSFALVGHWWGRKPGAGGCRHAGCSEVCLHPSRLPSPDLPVSICSRSIFPAFLEKKTMSLKCIIGVPPATGKWWRVASDSTSEREQREVSARAVTSEGTAGFDPGALGGWSTLLWETTALLQFCQGRISWFLEKTCLCSS